MTECIQTARVCPIRLY